MKEFKKTRATECQRIEEDSEQSSKRHFTAADRWSSYNNWLGIPSVLIAAIASAVSFATVPVLGGILTAATACLTAILTFLKPSERSASHTAFGNQYLRLRNETRMFREIDLPRLNDEDTISDNLKQYALQRDNLNDGAPITADNDYKKANDGIESGQTEYKVDKK